MGSWRRQWRLRPGALAPSPVADVERESVSGSDCPLAELVVGAGGEAPQRQPQQQQPELGIAGGIAELAELAEAAEVTSAAAVAGGEPAPRTPRDETLAAFLAAPLAVVAVEESPEVVQEEEFDGPPDSLFDQFDD